MKRCVLLACFFAVTASGTIQSITDLQPAQLVGTWEAVAVHLGLPTPCVYQILFSTPTEARFVAVLSPLPESRPMFLGKLSSSELKDGHITLQFTPIGDSADYEYQSVEIAGRANSSGDDAYIDGKITVQRRNGKSSTEPVLFANKLWVQDFAAMSKAAQEILRGGGSHP
jgi:hypothetical protein